MLKHTTCILCDSSNLHRLKGYYMQKGLIKCNNCGMVFMERIPSEAELSAHYGVYTYDGVDELSELTRESYRALLDEFEPYRKTNKIIDVGCGRGYFLEEAKKRGWEVYGTEFSQTAVQLLRQKGIQAHEGRMTTEAFGVSDFDIVTSFEVIEHINTPNAEIDVFHSILRKGGLLYITTPNFNSLMRYLLKSEYNVIAYPEHLSYYSKRTLNKLVGKHGFKNIKFLSTGISISRIQQSLGNTSAGLNADEKLRVAMNENKLMGLIKRLANRLLTFFNLGIALKGYYVKSQ
jgi:2-polyprenyl-3-methyl-5-hydroxy-6-metoxy-1,4-benzoquinol methylase